MTEDTNEDLLPGDPNEMTVFERMQYAARAFGVEIKDPNPDCDTCHGQGFKGYDHTGVPIHCHCVEPDISKETKEKYNTREMVARNRKERRAAIKAKGKIGRLEHKLKKLTDTLQG